MFSWCFLGKIIVGNGSQSYLAASKIVIKKSLIVKPTTQLEDKYQAFELGLKKNEKLVLTPESHSQA